VFVRTGYHTQVPEISGKLNGKKSTFTWATSFLLRSLGAEQLEPLSICSLLTIYLLYTYPFPLANLPIYSFPFIKFL
jgi:hypothetical protein